MHSLNFETLYRSTFKFRELLVSLSHALKFKFIWIFWGGFFLWGRIYWIKKLKVVFIYHPPPPPPPPNSASEDGVVPSSLNSKIFENNFFVKKIAFQKPQRHHFSLCDLILRYSFYFNSFGVIASRNITFVSAPTCGEHIQLLFSLTL